MHQIHPAIPVISSRLLVGCLPTRPKHLVYRTKGPLHHCTSTPAGTKPDNIRSRKGLILSPSQSGSHRHHSVLFLDSFLGRRNIDDRTAQLQTELWSTVRAPAAAQPTAVVALAVSGMNDVLNSQGYTQAAYWSRIPTAAWALMAAIAIGCNLLIGYGSRSTKAGSTLLPILPLVVSVAFMLIADDEQESPWLEDEAHGRSEEVK